MLEILKTKATKCQGRYKVLSCEEKPCLNDIAGDIAANSALMKEIQGFSSTDENEGKKTKQKVRLYYSQLDKIR